MINHVRTLLLNVSATDVVAPWTIGEELVPESYKAVELPSYLDTIRAKLFGASPDRSFLNYRLAQCVSILHAAPGPRGHVLAKDGRITYLASSRAALFGISAFEPSVITPGTVRPLTVQGAPTEPDHTGWAYHHFTVTRVNNSSVAVRQNSPTSKLWNLEVAYANGLSTTALRLGDSGYSVLVPTAADNTAWGVTFNLRPVRDLSAVLEDIAIAGEPSLLRLFGPKPVEPYLTFHNWFNYHDELSYRLSGVLLATAYRTDEVRQGVTRGN